MAGIFGIFTRLRVRILSIVLLAIIPAIGLIYYSAAERKRQISQDIESNTLRLSRFLASNLERDILQGQGYLKAAARMVHDLEFGKERCGEVLSELIGNSPVYLNLGIAGPDGSIICSANPVPEDSALAQLEWFRKAGVPGSLAVDFDYNGVMDHQPSLNLGMHLPPDSVGWKSERVLFAVMDFDWVNKLAENAQLPRGSVISVTARNGAAVARYPDPDKWVGKAYPPDLLAERNLTGSEGVRIAKGIDGVERLYAYSTVPAKGRFIVQIGVRREEAYAPANRALFNQLAALGLVSLLAILAAWFGADVFLIKQVRALIEATRRLAAGNLNARSSLSYDQGELGDLARAFDEMAEKVEWREAQLRESEIERANPINQMVELLEIAPEATLLLDDGYKIEAANHAARELFGYLAEDLVGRTLFAICPESSPSTLDTRPWSGDPSQPENFRVQTVGRHRNGTQFPIEIALSKSMLNRKSVVMAVFRVQVENTIRKDL